ncbi:MAG: choice-of-anchor J domain-containing protein [Flavobacteriaceae bacterium]|nr:choice-of-anchor J domain-containing protein [Flavobacteriaceae bacterium]
MKKYFTIVLIAFLLNPGFSQIFESGFENNNGVPLSEYEMINVDGLSVPFYAPVLEFDTNAWIQFYDGFDNKIAFSTSWYDPEGQSNDWLITPAITLPTDGNPTLYWKAKSYDFELSESYDIMVSTTQNEMSDFSVLHSVLNEQAFEFNSRTLNLSEFAGQTIYLAFVNRTNNGFYLALDEVYISNSADCYKPSISDLNTINLTENSFTVSWTESDGISSYRTGLTTFDAPVVQDGVQTLLSKSYENLLPGTRYQFFLKNADCGSGFTNPKSIWTAAILPYSYDFEFTEENYGEYDSDGWTSNTWINGEGEVAQSGSGYVFNNTSTSYAKNDWIHSYPIKLNANEEIQISFHAQMSTENASPATLKIAVANAPDRDANFAELSEHTITSGPFTQFTSTFTAAEEAVYYFGFGNVTPVVTNNAALRLDNIQFNAASMATVETQTAQISIYPVPVKNILHIQSSENVISVEVYNIEGRLVNTAKNSKSIDFSSLRKGNYILKITTDSGVIHKKIIK